ncbi:DEAD/DEAH box helicase family protein, partial [Clostridium sp.]|uniref:DEAD/DEAH box helicase family protein n=1 Tax=Clostridium sp. TaxID=1506 RepID=UPI002FC7116A
MSSTTKVKQVSEKVITGRNKHLYSHLKASMKKATSVDIIVSFLMESGVKMILDDIKEAVDRGVKIRILTGNYLNITQPQALYMIKHHLGDKIDLRFFSREVAFHPKAYIFNFNNSGEIFIGSSNLSRGALTSSVEWNYRIDKSESPIAFEGFEDEFNDLFNNHSLIIDDEVLRRYAKNYKKPKLNIESIEEEIEVEGSENLINLYEPRGAQIEALYKLAKSREEGYTKGIVVAATGIGKTYLSAFDSKEFEKVLFVAHRQEIIEQAHTSFGNVRPGVERGYFYGDKKEVGNSLTFALVQTLGREEYLNDEYFKADYFDYIVIDEFHHAAAGSYQRILDYFKPKFLLGLTATPERMDNKSVFKLCDYNLVYEIRLFDAINRGELVPFRYYGVHDTTVDYDNVTYLNGKYKSDELEKALMINKRGELVLKHFLNYKSNYALGFCETRKHAEFMAKYFSENGISAICVHSGEIGEYVEDRKEAIKLLNKGEVKVIFSVDMFNEGVDIPKVDLVMMLRPTQSPTVFLQQLGRGLRKYKDKEYLNVLDFIGNYRKANKIPLLLSGSSEKGMGKLPSEITYPEECYVNFDMTLIDIFKEQNKAGISIKSIVKEEYLRIKELLGETPTRVDLLTYMEEIIYEKGRTTKEFPLKNYLKYLSEEDILTEEEERILNSRAYDFINMIETTSMSKAYKMPILLAFYN